jgi:cell division protein YceG involved in septum cleavage
MNELAKIYTDKTSVYSPEYEDALKESTWKYFIEPGDFLLRPDTSSTNDHYNFCYKVISVEVLPKTEGYRKESGEWGQRVVERKSIVKIRVSRYNPFTKEFKSGTDNLESEYHRGDYVFKSLTDLEDHIKLAEKFLHEGLNLDQYFKVSYSDNDNLPVSLGSKDTYLVMEKGLQNTKLEIEKVKATVSAIIMEKRMKLEKIKE